MTNAWCCFLMLFPFLYGPHVFAQTDLAIGQQVEGVLTEKSNPFSFGLTFDAYDVHAEAGDILVVRAEADSFTPLLILAEGQTLVPSGIIPDGRRAELTFIAPRSGRFSVFVTVDPAVNYDSPRGPYTIGLDLGDSRHLRSRWIRNSIRPGSADYLDTESFERGGEEIYRVWILTRYADTQEGVSGTWDQSRVRYEIDCPGRRSRVINGYVYLGHELRASTSSAPWIAWPPESTLEGIGRAVCSIGPTLAW